MLTDSDSEWPRARDFNCDFHTHHKPQSQSSVEVKVFGLKAPRLVCLSSGGWSIVRGSLYEGASIAAVYGTW